MTVRDNNIVVVSTLVVDSEREARTTLDSPGAFRCRPPDRERLTVDVPENIV